MSKICEQLHQLESMWGLRSFVVKGGAPFGRIIAAIKNVNLHLGHIFVAVFLAYIKKFPYLCTRKG